MADKMLHSLQEIHKARIRLPYSSLLRLARQGKLPVRRIGKSYYGDPEDVMAALLPPTQEAALSKGRRS